MSLIDFSLQCGRLWKNAGKSADQIQTESIAAFRRMLEHAWKNTRFYPAFWGRSGICYEDLRVIEPGDIPCITKEDVRKNSSAIWEERRESGGGICRSATYMRRR